MLMIKCGSQNEDGSFCVTKSVGKEIKYNHNGSKLYIKAKSLFIKEGLQRLINSRHSIFNS